MKTPASLALAAALFVSASAVQAEPRNITTVSMDQVAQLESMHQQASDLLIKNDFQGALRAYSDILLTEPDDETAYTGLGQIYLVLGQFKKAHEAFENALQIDPYNEVALQGIQKIMDPDGVEGLVHRAQAEGLAEMPSAPASAPAPARLLAKAIEPVLAPAAKMSPRLGPVSPAKRTMKALESKRLKKKLAPKNFRPGFLNAQRLQMGLKNAGVYGGPVNGMIGPRTRQAVKKLQKMLGLDATGRLDNDTRKAVFQYLNFDAR